MFDAVAETYRLSHARYTKGIDSYLGVLDAQSSLYGAQHVQSPYNEGTMLTCDGILRR